MYTDHFGFSDLPFQLTPDARFYFDSRTHKKAMAYLGYGIAQGEGFIVITGEIGAGKSTLVQHLLATIDPSRLNAISLVSTQVEGDDMLRLAAQGMGIATDGLAKAQVLERVEQWLERQLHERKQTLLIVDEAQNLSTSALEELRMLSNYQRAGKSMLQIVLLGQPEFRARLTGTEAMEQLRQRVIASHHLDPMDRSEVEPYIVHRLTVVGWSGRPDFEDGAFEAIHAETGGVPRRINQLASRLMLYAAVENLNAIDADAVQAVASDMAADTPKAAGPSPVPQTVAAPAAPACPIEIMPAPADAQLQERIEQLEARLEEQERALRRVLTLLVDWVENVDRAPSYRHHAA